MFIVGRERLVRDRASEEVVENLDAPLGAYPIAVACAILEHTPADHRRLQHERHDRSYQMVRHLVALVTASLPQPVTGLPKPTWRKCAHCCRPATPSQFDGQVATHGMADEMGALQSLLVEVPFRPVDQW